MPYLTFFAESMLWLCLERCSFWPHKSVLMPQPSPCYRNSWNHSKHLCLLWLPVPSASWTQRCKHTAAGLHHKGSNQDALGEDKSWNLFSASGFPELTSLPHCKTHLLCSARVESKHRLLARVLSMHGLQTTCCWSYLVFKDCFSCTVYIG